MEKEEFKKKNLEGRNEDTVKEASKSPMKIGQTLKAFNSFCKKCKQLAVRQIMVDPKQFGTDQLCNKCRAKVNKIWK